MSYLYFPILILLFEEDFPYTFFCFWEGGTFLVKPFHWIRPKAKRFCSRALGKQRLVNWSKWLVDGNQRLVREAVEIQSSDCRHYSP